MGRMTHAKHWIAAAAASLLTACVSVAPPDNTFSFVPGTGVVEAVRQARVAVPEARSSGAIIGSASAGGSYDTKLERVVRPRWIEGTQLWLRMDDGRTQAVTQDSTAFQVGDRVEVLGDGRVLKR
jgi:outer membrane lipoprotein SlyB